MSTYKVATIIGARPQFIKAFPFSIALKEMGIDEVLIHTGQHYDFQMSDIFFEQLKLKKPEFYLGVGSGSHGLQTGKMLEGLESILLDLKPDLVVVFGDTNSTLAGALSAVKLHIPVAHIESGLRSFNMKMPEEVNRILTDRISSILFCSSQEAIKQLQSEGIKDNIFNVGDIMIDSLRLGSDFANQDVLKKLGIEKGEYFLVTAHRAENTDSEQRLTGIFNALNSLPGYVIFPMHPRTTSFMQKYGLTLNPHVRLIEPQGYFETLALLMNAKALLTDSGGMQKEAYYFSVPCITLRDETEWTETLNNGWNQLVGSDQNQILAAVNHVESTRQNPHPTLYGDGYSSQKICTEIANYLR